MAKIEKVDTDIAVALKFFGIQSTEIDKAKDIKWLEKQNIVHQLNRDKREQSNKCFAIIKQQQHRLDFVASMLQDIEAQNNPSPSSNKASQKWYEQEYKDLSNKQELTTDLNEFKESIEEAFMNVSLKDGQINTRQFNFDNNQQKTNDTNSYTSRYVNNNANRACGSCIAGAWLSIIGAIILLLVSFTLYYTYSRGYYGYIEEFNMAGPIMSGLAVWTIYENSKIISGTAKNKNAAGVLGLLFGFFLGGLLTLCGRYDEE